jgi:tetratricopeptide (TPR) repeat protein
MAYGPRREFEMEQVIPFQDPEDWDSDPITQAADAFETGDKQTAYQMMAEVLAEDLRCIDAHAHLGNWEFDVIDSYFDFREEAARRHYESGLRIAELSLGKNFHDLLPWDYINNRPYLRCLHGYGLCLWRTGKPDTAREIFQKMLWLNPRDNQGARFLLADVDAGKSWQQLDAEEKA